jgi:hypothetical protein
MVVQRKGHLGEHQRKRFNLTAHCVQSA